jgi:hypothetical protein
MVTKTTPLPAVTRFNDDLQHRAFPARFRNVGNPYAFLNDVGIVPVLEYIYKGNLLIDAAAELNVSYTILQNWVENEGHEAAIDEAQRISAEGYLAEGLRRLRNAPNEFELKRAKEMVAHARFMASKKDKGQYGGTEQQADNRAGVSYIFNIGGPSPAPNTPPAAAKPAIDSTHQRLEPENLPVVTFQIPAPAPDVAEHLRAFGVTKAFDELFAPVAEPTADSPEIGPFHD